MSEFSPSPKPKTTNSWRGFWAKDTGNDRLCYNTPSEAQPTQQLQNIKKTITFEEQQFVQTADLESLEGLLAQGLNDATDGRRMHATSRQTLGKVGKATVTFANNFSSFLQAYSGIVEIMQGADQQYGGIAYSALSLLLIVAVNKKRKEDHIDAALLTLQREFSRAKMLQEVHSSSSMKKYIADAYELGIQFVREITLYYSRPTSRRVLEAITKPPQLGIDLKISAITQAIAEIDKERVALDSQRLSQVQKQLEKVKTEVDKVKDGVETVKYDVKASHMQTERKHLEYLKGLLGEHHDPKEVLAQYNSKISLAFRNIQRLKTFSFDRFVQEESYSAWDRSPVSCMMLLHGTTAVTKTTYSWLSPALFGLVPPTHDHQRLVVFHMCQVESFMEEDVPAHTVLSGLIAQLLDAKASILRDQQRYEELSRALSDPKWSANRPEVPFAVLRKVLDSSPDLYPNVNLIVDRVDRIKGVGPFFMSPLVNLIKESKIRLKVFLISSSNGYDRFGGKLSGSIQDVGDDDQLGSDRFWSLPMNQ